MGHTNYFRRLSGDYRRGARLGSRTPGTFSFDLHTTTVAQLAGEGRFYYRWLYARAGPAFHSQLGRIDLVSAVVDDCGNSARDNDGGLHRVSFRTGEGARHVAKPTVATTFVFPVGTVGLSRPVASADRCRKHVSRGAFPGLRAT